MAAKIKIKKVDDKFVATVSDFIILANRSYSYEIVGKGYTEEYARAECLSFRDALVLQLNKIK